MRYNIMPKIKTHRGAAKRFKMTKSGKIKRKRANKRHILEHQSSKTKRHLRKPGYVHSSDVRGIRQMLPNS